MYTGLVIFRPADGRYAKWYPEGQDMDEPFEFRRGHYLRGSASRVTGAQLIPGYYGEGAWGDLLAFRSSDGMFFRMYNDAWQDHPFTETLPQYVGGAPASISGARLIPCDLNGDGLTDIVVFRSSDGLYAKWMGQSQYGFRYLDIQYLGGAPFAFSGAELIPLDFNSGGKTDFIVFRSSDGYFRDVSGWEDNPGFADGYPRRYVGGQPGSMPGATVIAADFDADQRDDVLIYRPSDGLYAKWYNVSRSSSAGWDYQEIRYLGGTPGAMTNVQLIPAFLNGDKREDILVFRPEDGMFMKLLSPQTRGPDFQQMEVRYIEGSAGALSGARLIPIYLDIDELTDFIVFRP